MKNLFEFKLWFGLIVLYTVFIGKCISPAIAQEIALIESNVGLPEICQRVDLNDDGSPDLEFWRQSSSEFYGYQTATNRVHTSERFHFRFYFTLRPGVEIAGNRDGQTRIFAQREVLSLKDDPDLVWIRESTNGVPLVAMESGREYDTKKWRTVTVQDERCPWPGPLHFTGQIRPRSYSFVPDLALQGTPSSPAFIWCRQSEGGRNSYWWIQVNRQPYFGFYDELNLFFVEVIFKAVAEEPIERFVLGPWRELNGTDSLLSGLPVVPERLPSVVVREIGGVPTPVLKIPPELCLKYEFAMSRGSLGDFKDRAESTYCTMALSAEAKMYHFDQYVLSMGRYNWEVLDEVPLTVWSNLSVSGYFKLIPHILTIQEKILKPSHAE